MILDFRVLLETAAYRGAAFLADHHHPLSNFLLRATTRSNHDRSPTIRQPNTKVALLQDKSDPIQLVTSVNMCELVLHVQCHVTEGPARCGRLIATKFQL